MDIEAYAKKNGETIPFSNGKYLPQPPFRMVFNAQSNSGKSTVIANLILRKEGYAGYFKSDRIHIFSPNLLVDDIWENLSDDTLGVSFDDFNMADLLALWEESKREIEKEGKKKDNARLIIVDDSIDKIFNRNGKPQGLEAMYTKARHDNISMIVSSQSYNLIPKTIRTNLNALLIFRLYNQKELVDIYKEHGGTMPMKEFFSMVQKVWSEKKYNFLFIDYTKDEKHKFRKNLTLTL